VLNVCSDGPERPRLEALARALGIDVKTRFRGMVADLAAEYRKASVLLTGSVLEQYSLTLMEAYSFGVPCIGLKPDWKTVFNSNEDQIRDGETGFIVRDESEMADRVDYLLTHEDQRRRMGCNALRMKQQGFTFEAFYTVIKDLLTGPVGGRNGANAAAADDSTDHHQ
jgi:glycosyltransferase involved in cell wall biosynthesis